MRASGGLAPVGLCEVLTMGNAYYAWSDRDLKNGSSVMAEASTPIATITFISRLIAGHGYPDVIGFTVTLTEPAALADGMPVAIAGNTNTLFNGSWNISSVLGPETYIVYASGLYGSAGTGGTSTSSGGGTVDYQGWIMGAPRFTLTGTTQTNTGTIQVQNKSGNTVTRDAATAFSQQEFIGALVVYRLWRADSEAAIFTFIGNVSAVEIDDDTMTLTLEGFGNWSAILAPAVNIDPTCGLYFGSGECGSTSSTPCQNTYGTCTSIERFKGVIAAWDWASQAAITLVQIAQPPPVVVHNPARAF